MKTGRDEERSHHCNQEDGGGRPHAVLSQLQGRSHQHGHHDQRVEGREQLNQGFELKKLYTR